MKAYNHLKATSSQKRTQGTIFNGKTGQGLKLEKTCDRGMYAATK